MRYVDPDGREKLVFFNTNKDKITINAANNYKNDGAIHIFAHGSSKGFTAHVGGKDVPVRNAKQLDKFLSTHSETWKNKKDGDNVTIILHSCRTGEGEDSFAQKVSGDLDGVTVIAPSERVYMNSDEELGTYKAKYVDENNEYQRDGNNDVKSKERSNEKGNWRVFESGKEIETYKGDWKPKEGPSWWDKFWNKN